ncbi:hypothetical protein RND81_14G208200 [Saponaria officinalis]|uniref:Mechanosensitive ion channel protein n=1 Tax=Saponaria officinalis TaxID=3572 RepID=A0AAW1GV05_SAPOF
MEFSLRKPISFKQSSHGSSSSSSTSSSFKHKNISSSSSSNYHNCDDDVAEHHPILSRSHNHLIEDDDDVEDISNSHFAPMTTTPTSPGEVVVKIDAPESSNKNNNIIDYRNDDIKEFSFKQSNIIINNDNNSNNNVESNSPTKFMGKFSNETLLDIDTSRQQQQQLSEHNREHSIRRQVLQGLPPLPPDTVSRQSFTRNQSDAQSPDSSSYNKISPQSITTNTGGGISTSNSNSNSNSNNNTNVNGDGLREVRVSFQESFNSDQGRRGSSIYSTVEEDDSPSSSTSSGSGDGDDDGLQHGVHIRKNHGKRIDNSSGGGGEVIRCTSSTSSRRLASMSMSKTKSRLMDPTSTPLDQRSGMIRKSGQINTRLSGLIGKSTTGLDDEEEDPFFGDDLPEEFKKRKVSVIGVIEWLILVLLVAALICSLVIPEWREKSMWDMRLWKWQVLIIVLICGRLVSDWGIKIIVFFIERNFLLRKRVLYFVYGLKKAVQNVIWLGLLLLTWHFLFDKKVEKEARSKPLKVVTKLLVIGEIGAFIWLIKTLLVKVCASFFHVNAFFDRIQESLFNQFVIETLSGPPLYDFQSSSLEEDERAMNEVQKIVQTTGINVPADLRASVLSTQNNGGKTGGGSGEKVVTGPIPRKSSLGQSTLLSRPTSKKQDEGITIENLTKLNQKNVSAWNMKRLMKIVRHGFLTTLDEQIVDATHNNNDNNDDDSSTQIRSEVQAKAAAKKMFRNVARPRCKYIYMTDLMRFMREDEALKTMSLFEGAAETERITKSALKNWVVNAFRERRAIALTLSDTKTAVNKLHKIVDVLVCAIIILISTILLDIITYKNLIFLSSQVVLVAFVFGNTCKNVFESIIFLFVIHPFDVGDRCEIDGVQMVVEEMNILTTVFLRFDNQKICFPNYILLTKPIGNFYRSPDMGDAIEFCFHITTPAEKINLIRQRIISYIVNKKEHWYPEPLVIIKDAEGLQMLRIAVWFQHRINHHDMGERYIRRSILLEECVKIFKEFDLDFRVSPINVNVHSMPPLSLP